MGTGAPKSTITILDLTTIIPSFEGVACGINIPLNFGSIEDDGILEVSDETDFLTQCTSRGVLEIGAPTSAYSATTYLKVGNQLRVKRILGDNYAYGGARIMATGSESVITVSTGSAVLVNTDLYAITDGQPVLYTVDSEGTAFDGLVTNTIYYMRRKTSPDTVDLFATQANAIANTSPITLTTDDGTHTLKLLNTPFFNTVHSSTFTVSGGNATVSADLYANVSNARPIVYSVTGGSAPTGIVNGTTYYLRKPSSNTLTLFASEANALANTSPITIGALGAGTHKLTHTLAPGLADPDDYTFHTNEAYILYQQNPGDWGSNDIVVIQEDFPNEDDSWYIRVYRPEDTNTPIPGEEFLVSRKHKTDGNGKQLFIEDVLASSKYIRAINNDDIDEGTKPTFDTTALSFYGGDDGDAVTDGEMIAGLDSFSDINNIQLTLFMDGGWSTVDYHTGIAELCASRMDTFGILSVPFAAENTSAFMTDIVAYSDSLILSDTVGKYVSLYTSHQWVLDKWNNRNIYIAPDGFVAGVICYLSFVKEVWYAAAGWKNASINVLKPLIKFDEPQRNTLYNTNINTLKYNRTRGVCVWGIINRQKRPSALRDNNVVLLTCTLIPDLRNFLEDSTFDFNDKGDRRLMTKDMGNYMLDIYTRRGVTDFEVIDRTTDNDVDSDTSRYRIGIKPQRVQQFIMLDLVVIKSSDNLKFSLSAT